MDAGGRDHARSRPRAVRPSRTVAWTRTLADPSSSGSGATGRGYGRGGPYVGLAEDEGVRTVGLSALGFVGTCTYQ